MEQLYKKYHYRSLAKLKEVGTRAGIDQSEIRAFWKSLQHDVKQLSQKDMQLPIYSNVTGSYQMDTLEQSDKAKTGYYLVLVNVNTRKAYAYPMKTKGSKDVLAALNKFIKELGRS